MHFPSLAFGRATLANLGAMLVTQLNYDFWSTFHALKSE
jgi:hypothetical protein